MNAKTRLIAYLHATPGYDNERAVAEPQRSPESVAGEKAFDADTLEEEMIALGIVPTRDSARELAHNVAGDGLLEELVGPKVISADFGEDRIKRPSLVFVTTPALMRAAAKSAVMTEDGEYPPLELLADLDRAAEALYAAGRGDLGCAVDLAWHRLGGRAAGS